MKRLQASKKTMIAAAFGLAATASAVGIAITSHAPKSAITVTSAKTVLEPTVSASPEPTIIVNGRVVEPTVTGPSKVTTGESTTTVTRTDGTTSITTVSPRTGTTSTVSGDGSMNVTVQTDNSNGASSMHQSVINTNQSTNDRTYSRSTVRTNSR